MTPHILLLRGINVGGRNMLPMRELTAIVQAAGGRDVRTHIQSGNVVCSVAPSSVAELQRTVTDAIQERFGFRTPVIARSFSEWSTVLAASPFPDVEHVHVAFLADVPSPERAARLDPDRSPGDHFVLVAREVFLHLPNGLAKTRLSNAWLDSTLKTTSTVRNWRTVLALGEMAAGLA